MLQLRREAHAHLEGIDHHLGGWGVVWMFILRKWRKEEDSTVCKVTRSTDCMPRRLIETGRWIEGLNGTFRLEIGKAVECDKAGRNCGVHLLVQSCALL